LRGYKVQKIRKGITLLLYKKIPLKRNRFSLQIKRGRVKQAKRYRNMHFIYRLQQKFIKYSKNKNKHTIKRFVNIKRFTVNNSYGWMPFFGYKEKNSKVIKTYIIGRLKRFFKIWGSIKKIYYNRYILVNKNVKRLVLIKINRGSISNKLINRKKINEKNMYNVYKNYLTYEYLWLPA